MDLEIPSDIEIVHIEINIRKQKWLFLQLYRNPSQNQVFFAENLTRIVDRYSASYMRVLITADLNMEVNDKNMIALVEAYELIADYVRVQQAFRIASHLLIYTILKTKSVKLPPIIVKYMMFVRENA